MSSKKTELTKTAGLQIDKFREAAREAETDDREEAFDEKVRRLAKVKPDRAMPKVKPTDQD